MALSNRAVQARLFMQRCRQSSLPSASSPSSSISTRAASSSSRFDPSNFGKPFATPSSSSSAESTTTAPWDAPLRAPNKYHHPTASSRPIPPANAKFTFTNWLRSLFGLTIPAPPTSPLGPFSVRSNPYRARKSWPPDFSKLHAKQQFHFEKTYRRRAALKWARPNWTRWVKLIQHTIIVTVLIYFVFICETPEGTPFDGFRVWFFGKLKNMTGLGEEAREEVGRLQDESRRVMEERILEQTGKSVKTADPKAGGS